MVINGDAGPQSYFSQVIQSNETLISKADK